MNVGHGMSGSDHRRIAARHTRKYTACAGDFDGVVHAVGMLFAGSLNRYASGSGSVPNPGTTYDKITRQTAFAATAALEDLARGGEQV